VAIKVVQWATGGVGLWSLRRIIDHPDLELAGVLVYSADKDGKDAGELCGRPSTGVKATRSKLDVIGMEADVVIMTPKLPEDDDLIALLRSGKDVISPLSYFAPEIEGKTLMARIEEACRVGGSTLLGAGIDPGFVCDRVPAVLTGVCAEVEQINMIEVFDCSKHPLADMMFNLLGFGKGPEDIHLDSPGGRYFSQRLFPAVLYKLARQLGKPLSRVEMGNVQFAFATRDFEIAAGKVGKGKIAGLSFDYTGYVGDKPFLRQRWVHHVGQHLGALPAGWRTAPNPEIAVQDGGTPIYEIVLDIVGRPNVHTRMLLSDRDDPVWQGTANTLINGIPDVLAAPPGFLEEPVFAPWRPRFSRN
jgi:hypothetical protein